MLRKQQHDQHVKVLLHSKKSVQVGTHCASPVAGTWWRRASRSWGTCCTATRAATTPTAPRWRPARMCTWRAACSPPPRMPPPASSSASWRRWSPRALPPRRCTARMAAAHTPRSYGSWRMGTAAAAAMRGWTAQSGWTGGMAAPARQGARVMRARCSGACTECGASG
jgi:hypothetical protein